jgi:outer membrane protein TolC
MRWIMLLLAPVMTGAPLAAQSDRGLTLAEVYGSLAGGSPRIAAAHAQADAARARIGPVSRWPDPAIQLGLMNRNLPGLGLQDPLGMNQIQVMQMIPVAGKTKLAVKAARAEADAEASRAQEVGWEVRTRAAMSFYDLYQADETLGTMAAARRLLQEIIRTTETMYAEGKGRQTDVLRAQVELARMDEEIIRMASMRDGMAARLNSLRGLPVDTPVPTPLLPRLPDSLPGRDALESRGLADRPMLAAGQSRVASAEAEARRAGREIWPDLTVGVIYGQRPMLGGGTERMGSFMLGFTLPLAAGSRQRQMTAEARAMAAMASADLEDMRTETRGRIGEVHADLLRARRLTQLYRTTLLPELRATATAARASYESGGLDFMTLLDSQMAIIRAEQELIRFEADAGRALAELEMLTATELVDPASTADPSGGAR